MAVRSEDCHNSADGYWPPFPEAVYIVSEKSAPDCMLGPRTIAEIDGLEDLTQARVEVVSPGVQLLQETSPFGVCLIGELVQLGAG